MTEIVVATLGEEAFYPTYRRLTDLERYRYNFEASYPPFRFTKYGGYSAYANSKTASKYLEPERFCGCQYYNSILDKIEFCSKCIDKNALMRNGSIWFNFPHCPKPEKVAKDKIPYNNSLSMAQIKQVLKKIDYEEKKISGIVFKIEKMLHFISLVNTYIEKEKQDDEYYILYASIILEQRDKYLEFYNDIIKYFDNIPNLKQKYMKLMSAHKAGNVCVKCFAMNGAKTNYKEITEIVLKRKKNCMTCNVCLSKRKDDTIVMDCPVCMEDFKKSKMTEAKCGNGHFLCNRCYEKMSGMTTDYGRKYTCPMCRGNL